MCRRPTSFTVRKTCGVLTCAASVVVMAVNLSAANISANYGPPAAASTWQQFTIPLTAAGFNTDATTFNQVMASVTRFRIRTEMRDGDDVGAVDDVAVGALHSSDFAAGADGWSASGDGTLSWQSSGGHAGGGYIQVADWANGDWHYAVAPSTWLGNWTAAIGSNITFWMKTDHPDYASVVEISGGAGTIQQLSLGSAAYSVPTGQTTVMTVGINKVAAAATVVTLSSSTTSAFTVPASATIPTGQLTTTFNAVAGAGVGTSSTITAAASGYDTVRVTLNCTAAVVSKPDFVVTNIRLDPAQPGVGTTFTAYVRVRNAGTLAGKVGTVGIWLDKPGADVAAKFKADKTAQSSVGLRPGQSILFVFTGLAAGTVTTQKTFRAFADAANGTAEASETNNQATLVYTIPPPDFTVTAITLSPDYLDCNKTFTAYVTVRNAGVVPGNADFLDVWVNPNPVKTAATTNKGDKFVSVGVLAAGESKRITVTGLKAGLANGRVQALIDSRAKTAESNENNNSLTVDYVCQP